MFYAVRGSTFKPESQMIDLPALRVNERHTHRVHHHSMHIIRRFQGVGEVDSGAATVATDASKTAYAPSGVKQPCT